MWQFGMTISPAPVGIRGEVLVRHRRCAARHPHAEREPDAVESQAGDRLGQRGPVHAVQARRDTEILMSAEPVHPGQPDPVAAGIHDEPAAGAQRCGNRHIRSSYGASTRRHSCADATPGIHRLQPSARESAHQGIPNTTPLA
jgi:hypothetical protein